MLRDEHPTYRQNYERLGIEVVQGSILWDSGRWMKCQINVHLRVWGIKCPKLGLTVYNHYQWTLFDEKDKERCLALIDVILKEGELREGEPTLLRLWREMISEFKPYDQEDLFGCTLRDIGLEWNDEIPGDGEPS